MKLALYALIGGLLATGGAYAQDNQGAVPNTQRPFQDNQGALPPVQKPFQDNQGLPPVAPPPPSESSVIIVNGGNRPINFTIRPKGGVWANDRLAADAFMTVSCSGCTTVAFEISITTEGREVHYDLAPFGKYQIEWNDKASVWDVYMVK